MKLQFIIGQIVSKFKSIYIYIAILSDDEVMNSRVSHSLNNEL